MPDAANQKAHSLWWLWSRITTTQSK